MHSRNLTSALALCGAALLTSESAAAQSTPSPAKNVIFFVGDGMGVSTVTATRIYSVGVAGKLAMDKFPYVALSRTYSADTITPDSAPTMSAMVSGVNTNNGVLGFGPDTENKDFLHDGDGLPSTNVLELAKAHGKRVGVVSTARITHATPAACYAHIDDRDNENAIALQALPTDPTYNPKLLGGVDLLFGGGRQFFVPTTVIDEEGGSGSRTDGRDLRAEFQTAGYSYVWNATGFAALGAADLPVLGLFERSHMEWEYDRPTDLGGEPSIVELTSKAIEMLDGPQGYFLMVEGGRIDHAHHAGNAFRAITDAEALDQAIAAAVASVNLDETLILVTADHSHVFNIAGYPLRPVAELPYAVSSAPAEYLNAPHSGLFSLAYDVNVTTGAVSAFGDKNGVPYTTLVYGNGPGYRGGSRVDPSTDPFLGLNSAVVSGPTDVNYLQEAAVPMSSETHAAEEVAIYGIGRGAARLRGTVKNTACFALMKTAFGF
ncbi:MAG: alkaline phosphatase [Planctomycetes bacterium]|nr:alkaline phosphatase [Planctomycetota bacterium]